jgi:hypothetical protein
LLDDPSAIWSLLNLVVLTLTQLDLSKSEQSGIAARANACTTDSFFALMSSQLKGAMRVAHSAPPNERIRHHGVLALPLPDRDLGAALVQYRASEATAQGELDQARVLVMGDTHMLWLAHDVVRARPYPDEAVPAYAKLAPLARQAVGATDADAEAARSALGEATEEELDAETSARVMSTVEQLRRGRSAEQLRAGTAGYEAGARA